MFWNKKPLNSEEYLKLRKEIEEVKVKLESYKLDLDLHKKKLRVKANLEQEETKDIYNGMLLPEDGYPE